MVVALVGMPVAALTLGLQGFAIAGAARTAEARQNFGHATATVATWASVAGSQAEDAGTEPDEAGLRDALGLGDHARLLPRRTGSSAVAVGEGARARVLLWEEVDLTDPLMEGRFELSEGRLPIAPGEALALGDDPLVATDLLSVTLPRLDLRIVGRAGLVEGGRNGSMVQPGQLVVAPGTMPDAGDAVWTTGVTSGDSWFVGGPIDVDDGAGPGEPGVVGLDQRPEDTPLISSMPMVALSTLGFVWCGLIAASALAIGTRRRRRELGLLAANGASPADLRRAVIADGVVLGGVGAILGGAAGLVASALLVGRIEDIAGVAQAGQWVVSPLVLVALAMGWASAAMAGSAGARGLADQPVVDLLAGRAPAPRGAPAWFRSGGVTGAACLALTAWLASSAPERGPLLYIGPAVTVLLGVVALVCLSVGGIGVAPHVTRRSTVAGRLAARDLARFGARTAAASAAVALTISGATTAAIVEQTAAVNDEREARSAAESGHDLRTGSARSERGIVVEAVTPRVVDGRLDVGGDLSAAERSEILERVEESGAHSDQLQVVRSQSDVLACAADAEQLTEAAARLAPDGCVQPAVIRGSPWVVATLPDDIAARLASGSPIAWIDAPIAVGDVHPQLLVDDVRLPMYGVDRPQLREGMDGVVTSLPGSVTVVVPEPVWDDHLAARATTLVAVRGPNLSDEEWRELSAEVARVTGAPLQWWDVAPNSKWPRAATVALFVAGIALVVLGILALALVLVRIESRDEERTLLTQGASPRIAAAVAAWRAVLMTTIGGIPAVVLTSAVALLLSGEGPVQHARPVSLAAILLGLPVLAGLVFGLSGRRAPRPTTV